MEGFNELLLKLRDVHEQEVERWHVKVQELSNKKGCDSKRMEELFTRNQQMKEQQRLLTENIKTLENRLRAGLCDRCTVTQEVAKRRQQEFEVLQMQSLQHITLLAGEMTNLKKENKRLKDEIGTLRAMLNNTEHSPNSSGTIDVKANSSPELSPVALITTAISRATGKPIDGDVAVKTEADHRTEESEHRQIKGLKRGHFPPSLSTYISPSWKTGLGSTTAAERRSHTVDGLGQRTSIYQTIPPKRPSPSGSGEVNPGRHVLHAPVPCRPHAIINSPVAWNLSESPDWLSAASAGTNMVAQPLSKSNLPHYPNLIPTGQHESHSSPRRQVFVSPWHKQSSPQRPTKEPTVVFRVRSLSEHTGSQVKSQERREALPAKAERVSGEGFKEVCEGPLDLSDRGKSVSSHSPRGDSPLPLQGGERLEKTTEKNVKPDISAHVLVSSPSPAISPSSSVLSLRQEEDSSMDQNHKVIKEQGQTEEANGKTDQGSGIKVPVLSLSFCPVVVLETLNSALQKHESSSTSGKSSSPTARSRSEEQEEEEEEDEEETASGPEAYHGCKRKRASVEMETHRDSDMDERERKVTITMRADARHSDAV